MRIRRDSYALVLVSHCVIPFVFDVKLARDDSVVIVVSSLMALMTDQVPNVRVKAAIMSSWFRCVIDVIDYTRKAYGGSIWLWFTAAWNS